MNHRGERSAYEWGHDEQPHLVEGLTADDQ
jgi:hypothetical protein